MFDKKEGHLKFCDKNLCRFLKSEKRVTIKKCDKKGVKQIFHDNTLYQSFLNGLPNSDLYNSEPPRTVSSRFDFIGIIWLLIGNFHQ